MDNESWPFQAPSALRSLQVPAATAQVRLARVAASTSANHAVHRKTVIEKGIHIESLHAIIIPLQLIPNRLKIELATTLESEGTPQKKKYSTSVQLLYSAISFASYLVVILHRRLGFSTKERSTSSLATDEETEFKPRINTSLDTNSHTASRTTTNLHKTVAQNQSNNHMKPLTRLLTYHKQNEKFFFKSRPEA
jgi:hypothetical protein